MNTIVTSKSAFASGSGSGSGSGPKKTKTTFINGNTGVIQPTGEHLATVVWLHSVAQNSSDAMRTCQSIIEEPLPNVKFICLTAPTRYVHRFRFAERPYTAWFNVGDNLEEGPIDMAEVEESAAYVANLVASDPPNIKVVIGGFSMGACIALYSAIYFCTGRFPSGNPYPPINLKAIVGVSGHLHGSRNLRDIIDRSPGARARAESLHIWMRHSTDDNIVPYRLARENVNDMRLAGYERLQFISAETGHYLNGWLPAVAKEIRKFLIDALQLKLDDNNNVV